MFILFWGLMFTASGFFWLLSLVALLVGRKSKSRLLAWAGGVPLSLLTGAGVLVVLLAVESYYHEPTPESIYKESFNIQPSSDVTSLQGSDSSYGDSGTAFLKFNAAPATLQRITAKGWKRLSAQQAQHESFSGYQDDQAPSWWRPITGKTTVIYEAINRSGSFSTENEILIYDKATKGAYYAGVGID